MAYCNFDGDTGKITVSGFGGVTGTRHRGISFWLRTTQSGIGTICYWGDDLTDKDYVEGSQNRVRLINGKLQLFGLGSFRETESQVNDGSFHHVLFNWTSTAGAAVGHEDFSTADVYIDQVLDNGRNYQRTGRDVREDFSDQYINTPDEEELIIGCRPGFSGTGFEEFYDGDLDEFAIYNDFVHSDTLSGIYAGGTPGADLKAINQEPALQLWYTMGDDPGDTTFSGGAPGTMVDQAFIPPPNRNGTVSSGVVII